MADNRIKVLLVDDHQVLRDGLRLLLTSEEDIEIVGEASEGHQVFELIETHSPDVVIMDLGLPDISGIEVTRQICSADPGVRVVVLSMHTRKEFVLKSIEAGAAGYVPKSSTHESLLDAIRAVHAGNRYIHPQAAASLVDTYFGDEDDASHRFRELTNREQEVFRLAARGYTSREIGGKLIISPKTADTYRQRAFEKLNIEHRSEMIRLAVRLGILDDLKD